MNDIDYYRQQLSEYSHRAFRRHLVGGTGGNLSIRIPGTRHRFGDPDRYFTGGG